MTPISTDPSHLIDHHVTLIGTAEDAQAGAVVYLSDGNVVYVRGLREWDPKWHRKQVKVAGTIRRRKLAPDPETNAKGEVSHGMEGDSLTIEEATWEEAP